jgi:hypothetical protein
MILRYHYKMITPPSLPDAPMRPSALKIARPRAEWLDAAGITVSVVCAIHCAASAAFLAALTLLGLTRTMPEWLEWAFLTASLLIGTIALRSGHRAHGQSLPLRLFGLGITALLLARVTGLSSPLETILVVVGATALITAHALNWRHGRACTQCAPAGESPSSA